MHINRYFGRSLCFSNGFSLGFNWMHGNGGCSKSSAVLAAYHPPKSITWLWSLTWSRPSRCRHHLRFMRVHRQNVTIVLPFVGGISVSWQAPMWQDVPVKG